MQLAEIRKELRDKGVWHPTRYWQADGYTCAVVEVDLDGRPYTGVGFSKYNPNDARCPDTPYSDELGRQIAYGKAELDAARYVLYDRAQPTLERWFAMLGENFRAAFALMTATVKEGVVKIETPAEMREGASDG